MGESGHSCSPWEAPMSSPLSSGLFPQTQSELPPRLPACRAGGPPGLPRLRVRNSSDHAGCHFLSPGYVPLRRGLLFSLFYRGANRLRELNNCPRPPCSQIPACDQSPGHSATAIKPCCSPPAQSASTGTPLQLGRQARAQSSAMIQQLSPR